MCESYKVWWCQKKRDVLLNAAKWLPSLIFLQENTFKSNQRIFILHYFVVFYYPQEKINKMKINIKKSCQQVEYKSRIGGVTLWKQVKKKFELRYQSLVTRLIWFEHFPLFTQMEKLNGAIERLEKIVFSPQVFLQIFILFSWVFFFPIDIQCKFS